MIREGKQHEVWRCGATLVTIPRHREINEYTPKASSRTSKEKSEQDGGESEKEEDLLCKRDPQRRLVGDYHSWLEGGT